MVREYDDILSDDMRDRVAVRYLSAGRGKGVIALQPYKHGDVVFRERPLVCHRNIMQTSQTALDLKSCAHCMRTFIDLKWFGLAHDAFATVQNPVSCEHCRKETYCSDECCNEAWNKYHRILCIGPVSTHETEQPLQILQLLAEDTRRTNPLLIARMFAMVLIAAMEDDKDPCRMFDRFVQEELPHGRDTLALQLIEEHLQGKLSADKKHLIDKWVTLSRYRRFNGLIQRNASTINPISDLQRYVQDMDPENDARQISTLRALWHKLHEGTLDTIDHLSAKDIQQAILLSQVTSQQWTILGTGAFIVHNCMNHSCRPCVTNVSSGTSNELQVVALRPIEPGDELTISYIDETLPIEQRQALLWQQYRFRCRCDLCTSGK